MKTLFKQLFLIFGGVFFFISIFYFYHLNIDTFYTQNSLDIVSYWHNHSIIACRFIPTTWDASSLVPKYNLSNPPFSYYALYIFQILFGEYFPLIINIFLTFLSSIFVYLTIAIITRKQATREFSIFGVIGSLIYITSYPVLKYQLLNYHPDIFIQSFIIILIYLLMKAIIQRKQTKFKYFFWYAVISLIINYSSWYGFTLSFVIALMGIFNYRISYKMTIFTSITIIASIVVLMFVYSQYAMVGGWGNVFKYFQATYMKEAVKLSSFFPTLFHVVKNIIVELGLLFFWFIFLVMFSILKGHKRFKFTKNGYKYILINTLPILLYGVLLFRYAQNSYLVLFLVPMMVVAISIWLEKMNNYTKNIVQTIKLSVLIILTNLVLLIFI